MEPDLILVRGLPGSGKSTLASKMAGRVHLETDGYFALGGTYTFDSTKLGLAHRWCECQTYEALRAGKRVVVSNTFVQLWEMKSYLEMAEAMGRTVQVIKATGTFKNIHEVPVKTLEKMQGRWEDFPGEVNA